MITYTHTTTKQEITQIVQLGNKNLPENLSLETIQEQGFVTIPYNETLLWEMHQAYPHTIAKNEKNEVMGYALVLTKEFKNHVPILIPMFELFEQITYRGRSIKDHNYFVMGQICVAKAYRKRGVSQELYRELKRQMAPNFDFVLTEVASRNTGSMKAHERIGFKTIKKYKTTLEDWEVLLWDWLS